MKKQTFIYISITLVATVCFFAAGLWLNLGQGSSAAADISQPVSAATQPLPEQLFDFGDENRHQILLELAANPGQEYTLTTISLDDPLANRQIAVCTHSGVPVVVPPTPTDAQQVQDRSRSIWERVTAWFSSPASDSYFVTLWSPNDAAEAYVLVSGDGPAAPVVCSSLMNEDV